MTEQYDADYYLRGKETGKSLYSNYRWLPELTVPMCQAIADHCGFERGCKILDFGCARGYTVKALRGLGYDAYGIDASEWAIRNGDEEVAQYLNWTGNSPPLLDKEFDWVIAKDVLEHVTVAIRDQISRLMAAARTGVFVVVPLTAYSGSGYEVPEYEKDVTHLHRLSLSAWVNFFIKPGWSVDARYRLPGVKDNYKQYSIGNGFVTCRRLSDS